MKFKVVQLLTVSLVTVLVFSPELVVFSIVWEQHLELKQTKTLACQTPQNVTSPVKSESKQESSEVNFSTTHFLKESLAITKKHKIVQILHWSFLLFPIFLGILIFFYDRYLIYRATVFQKQVEMLERLWQQGIEQ
ncbi:hypothetical protein BZZ01_20445 [Nostocales cyanobacterium HT-58-2]|nr:hypothetical protein BZZ01_20445 [Nostocales cyanobacterium HT-58-2]